MQHLANFGALTQQGFRVISKTTFDNLWTPFHDIKVIPFSVFSLNLKNGQAGGIPLELKEHFR